MTRWRASATSGEVDAAVRNAGHGRLEATGAVVLETDGSISVIAASGDDELTGLRTRVTSLRADLEAR